MTTQDMIVDVFEMLWEPSDLEIYATPGNPATFDITLEGSQKILRYLNQALSRVAHWKFRDGRFLRFQSLYSTKFWKSLAPLEQIAISSGTGSVEIAGLANNVAGQFDGWIAEITEGTGQGQVRIVTDTTVTVLGVNLVVSEAWDTALDGTSKVSIYKSFALFLDAGVTDAYADYHIKMNPNTVVSDILKVRDINDKTDLGRAYFGETYEDSAYTAGIPTEWLRFGDRIQFNAALAEERTYELKYYKHPTLLTTGAQEPCIPVPWHEAIILHAVHRLRNRAGDFEGQYVDKKNLEDLMESLREQNMFTTEMEQGSIVVWG